MLKNRALFGIAMAIWAILMIGQAAAQLNFMGPKYRAATGSDPSRVAAADINGDGDVDVVCTNQVSNTVSVFLGDGAGNLALSQTRGVGAGPIGIVCVDVNADGKRDILTANRAGNSISVLLGNNNGTFQPATTTAVGAGTNPREIATADIDGDGDRDVILVMEGTNQIQIRYNNGSGTFGAANTTLSAPATPYALRVSDFDGDGDRDIFVAINSASGGVRLFRNNGSAAFPASLQSTITWPGATTTHGIGIADLDGDTFLDLVVTEGTTPIGAMVVLFGNGTPNFSYSPSQRYRTAGNPLTLTIADIDADGADDIAVSSFDDGVVDIFWNDFWGDFSYERSCQGTGTSTTSVALADLDGDSELDMIACVRGVNELRTYMSRSYAIYTYIDPWEPNLDGPMGIDIDFGADFGNQMYFLGVSAAGCTPAYDAGGGHIVPLVFDALTSAAFAPASPYFIDFVGVLDPDGYAFANVVPPSFALPSLAGLDLHFVVVTGMATASGFQITGVSSAVANGLL